MGTHAPEIVDASAPSEVGRNETLLFWASFSAIVATAFCFVIRGQILGDWRTEFKLTNTEVSSISGVGLWPFAISIVLFSLIIDWIGYGKTMIFAFVCHVASVVLTIMAKTPEMLYWSTFIAALGNGTVEAVTNPVVATLFPREKTKWLNRLHAGWPGGLVLGGIIALSMGSVDWRYKVGLIFLPVITYGVLMLGRKFPVNERVAAGVSYKPMLQEVGVLGALIVTGLIIRVLGTDVLHISGLAQAVIALALAGAYGAYTRTLGQPLFIAILLIMIPLATTELGTDSWIGDLMTPAMAEMGLAGGWVLIYTSLIMLILRFFAGPIVHKLSPLGLLAMSAAVAACGLAFLSKSQGLTILAAATVYGFGKAFFWPTMLGVVAEQFPKGGALTLNFTGGVGMLAVGAIGVPFLGNLLDTGTARDLKASQPALYEKVVGEPKTSVFGTYQPLEPTKVDALDEADRKTIDGLGNVVKKEALLTVAILPCVMLACYLGLIAYFRSQGGYKPKILVTEREEELMMTGGTVGPSEM